MRAKTTPSLSDLKAAKKFLLEQRLQGVREQRPSAIIPRRAARERAPLSFAQQRLYFLDQWEPNSPMYNMPIAVRVRGRLNVPALEQALNAMIQRHEVLRSRFVNVDGEPVQEISPAAKTEIPVHDARDADLHERLNTEARKPFDLQHDLLIRCTLFRVATQDHVLLICMHHIASDAWSFGVLFQELSELYNALDRKETLQLPDLPIQYADYAAWQRETFNDKSQKQHLDYWKQQLAGAPDLLELPTDRPRPAMQTFRGRHRVKYFPAALSGMLQKIAQQARVTQFMLLLSVFKIVLHKYSRQEDIVVGSPIAGRTLVETERLIGFFINTLVMRTDLSGDPTFLELLDRVRAMTLEAYAHQELPFERLVEELKPERTGSYTPIVQTMFVLHTAPQRALKFGDASVEFVDVNTGTSKFDMVFSIEQTQDGLIADLEYNADLFDETSAASLLENFSTLLERIAADPEKRVSELSLVSEEQKRQLLVDWNQTVRSYPREASIPELFELQVNRSPGATAIAHGERAWTYAEVDARANRLAHYLKRAGLQPGQAVAVFLDRGAEMIITFLAILKAGGAYLPLDRGYPKDRITFMLNDAGAPILITEERLLTLLPHMMSKAICLDRDASAIQRESSAVVSRSASGESLAYIIYTSGSTGQPKGVCIPQRAVVRLVVNTDYVSLEASDVVAQVSNCSFDAATWEIWGALLNGGRLVIFPEALLAPQEFAAVLRSQGITAMFITTALFNQFAAECPAAFATVKHLLVGGEAMDSKWVAEVFKHGAPHRFLNVYGPTETTTYATWHLIAQAPGVSENIPIGRPIANTEAYVLDQRLNPVPVGVPGELYLGGDGLAQGYLNRPDLNAEKFISNPFREGRLYRTGDLVRYRPDGNIQFLGRLDHQVKIRGFRVELGEIESVLAGCPDVRQCTVVARTDGIGAKQLVAYYSVTEGTAVAPDDVREFLQSRLPSYMIPGFILRLPTLPLNANGKIDRRALPAPESSLATKPKQTAPEDAVERELQQIWEEVLGIRPIGTEDKFFELGGHSLLALRLIAQIEKRLGRKLSVTTIFQRPTIRQLAAVLRDQTAARLNTSLVEIQPKGTRPPLILVHGVGGGMFWGYSYLSKYLGDDQPVYVIKSRGLDGQPEFETIEGMAAQYVKDLKAFQPKGPYYLGGYCFGGVVAYEMSRQLVEAGEEVTMLALMNSNPPNSSYTRVKFGPLFVGRFLVNIWYWGMNALQWTPEQQRGFIRWKLRLWSRMMRRLIAIEGSEAGVEDWVDVSTYSEDQRKLWETHIRALMNYHPKPYAGHVTLFRSRVHHAMSSYDPQYGWGDYARGGVTVKVMPAAHESIIDEPNVARLAAELREELTTASRGVAKESLTKAVPPGQFREVPLSCGQEQLWSLLASLGGHSTAMHSEAYRMRGLLDVKALERSFEEIERRHERLRANFIHRNGTPVQVIAPPRGFRLRLTEIDSGSARVRADKLQEELARERQTPFDLERDQLFRGKLLRLGSDDFVLAITLHKLVCDEPALHALCRELELLYEAFSQGKGILLADPLDLCSSIPDQLQTSDACGPQGFAVDDIPGLKLPSAATRDPEVTPERRTVSVSVPQKVVERLKRLGAQEGLTLFLVLMAATGALLYRYTRQETFALHALVNPRNRAELRNLIGWFSQFMLLRMNFSGTGLNFVQLAHRTRHAYEESCASGCFTGYGDVLKSLPRLQVGVSYVEGAERSMRLAGLQVERLVSPGSLPLLPITFAFSEVGRELFLDLHYAGDLVTLPMANRLATQMAVLLGAIADNSSAQVARLQCLDRAEENKLLVEWNRTDQDFPTATNYWHLFAQQAHKSPDTIAVRSGDTQLTYAGLEERASRLADVLVSRGIGPEKIVGVALPRSLDLAVAILAVMKAGAGYLPLDIGVPRERLRFIVEDAGAALIVTREAHRVLFSETRSPVLSVSDLPATQRLTTPKTTAENLAYVMYTSGSTGTPKGVQITHRSLLNHNCAVIKAFGLVSSDRVLQFAALNFDLSIEEMFPAWLCGAAVVFRPDDAVVSVSRLLAFVRDEKITVLDLPTAYWHVLVEACKDKALPECLRLVVIGGEEASAEHWRTWNTRVRHSARLLNTYGPTETTIISTLQEGGLPDGSAFPIGRPIANTKLYVLDENMQLVPIGVTGELYIGGAGVARGYLNRPELTADRFVQNPFGSGRLYRTGDLVRYREEGALEFVGRADAQVKIRGFRVEPGEVEKALLQHPAVKECVVTTLAAKSQELRLAAYYVPRDSRQTAPSDLLRHLQERLPEYMIPWAIMPLKALPLTTSGKVNRQALPAPQSDVAHSPGFAPAQTELQKEVAKIWCDILGVSSIGLYDNFFHLGGHSLHAMRMISRVQARYGAENSIADFFSNPTLAAFIVGLIRVSSEEKRKKAPPVRRASRHTDLPLSFAQQRLWFLDQLNPNNPVYNLPQPIRLTGTLDFGALERALNEIVQRHESLRTNFLSVMGTPVQKIAPSAHLRLAVIDLTALDPAVQRTQLRSVLQSEAQKPFDLQRDLMLRASLVKVGADEAVLLLNMHHIASDGWSVGQLLDELAQVYNAFARNEASPLPELPIQYADFALWQRDWLQQGTLDEQLGYWKRQLAGVPSLFEWPADHSRPAVASHRGDNYRFVLGKELTIRLEQVAEMEGCTLFMTLLAGFQTLAHRYTGREDIVTGSVIANRNLPEIEPLIGFFVNTLALRTKVEPRLSFRELLRRVRETTLEAYSNQDVPFEKLVEELEPERDSSFQPLVQTMLILQNVPMPEIPGSNLTWEPFELDVGYSRFDLTVEFNQTAEGLTARIEYARDLFEVATIERMAAHLQALLAAIVEAPDLPIAELDLLTPADKHRLVHEWNSTLLPYPEERRLHELFEEQAATRPNAPALIFKNETLTYAELDRRANQVAAELRTRGAGPESLVAICHGRTPNLVAGILGILKAGAAYVPMDPRYPKERLDFMLEDTKAKILITESMLLDRFRDRAVDTICLDSPVRSPVLSPASPPDGHSRNAAYVIFTSGSTGQPKGVVIEHRSAVSLVFWAKQTFVHEELNGVLAATSVCFDLSVFEMFVPLCLGGRIILADNVLELPTLPAANQVVLVNTVPSALTQLLEINGLPESVRVVNLAGEPLSRQLVDRIYEKPHVRKVYDLYGPTEDTVYATCALRKPAEPATIGRPVANNRLYILSPNGQLVPQGAAGELYIGGDGLARGYLNRPELTQERFVPDAFTNRDGARLYRTGDLVRYRADGNLEFLGRIDHQVKIRGYRVELGEIEENLRQHPLVRDAVVMARPDLSGDKRLAAYITARNNAPPPAADIQRYLNQRLPDYMVPPSVVVMERFPLTPNGKVDRKALPEPDLNQRNSDTAYVEASTDLEKLLIDIWREVLEVQRIGVHDNFFKLGGHSLKVTQVISRVREAIQMELPMRLLFEAPTVAALAVTIEDLLIKELEQLSEDEAQKLNRELEQTV